MLRPGSFALGLLLACVAVASAGGATQTEAHWMITDLGTLGGREAVAAAINSRGQIVGSSSIRGIDRNHAFLWQAGKMADLGGLHREWETVATDINERGQIIGSTWRWDAEGYEVGYRTLLWERGKLRPLTSGARENQASAIDDRGRVVGWVDVRPVSDLGLSPTLRVKGAGVWQAGAVHVLRTPLADSEATALNGVGQVVGVMGGWERGFIWRSGRKMSDLGRLGNDGWIGAITDKGEIVGARNGHATLWVNGVPRTLRLPRASHESGASDINGRGQVVGWWDRKLSPRTTWAVVWEKGKPTLLPDLPGGVDSQASAINERGQIVGSAEAKNGATHAVLWTLRRG